MKKAITDLFNLHRGEERKQKTLDDVRNNISFTGSNLWILICAIMIASVGLNVNSTAVVIGAMLISPLMGPIVGAGFALGVYDFQLLKKSLLNLLIATIASLIVATAYFYVSPFKQVQSELLARTSPNIYDVLIAFFGGLAGVIAITRTEKGNPIAGVAIATALMPPLCTAGYGLATGNWRFFLGALFLYCINCVFICIATFSIVKYLKYPPAKQIDTKYQKQIRYGVTIIVMAMLLPSGFFAFSLLKKQQFIQAANNFIEKEFNDNTLVYKKINYTTNSPTIELAFLQKKYSDNEVNALNQKAEKFGLQNTKIIIRHNSSDNLQALKKDILNELNKNESSQTEKEKRITELEQKIATNTFDNRQLLSEIKILFPNIHEVSVSKQNIATKDTTLLTTMLFYNANPKLNKEEMYKLKTWMQKRINNIDSIKLTNEL